MTVAAEDAIEQSERAVSAVYELARERDALRELVVRLWRWGAFPLTQGRNGAIDPPLTDKQTELLNESINKALDRRGF